jgi:hypothetical protein
MVEVGFRTASRPVVGDKTSLWCPRESRALLGMTRCGCYCESGRLIYINDVVPMVGLPVACQLEKGALSCIARLVSGESK